MKLISKKDIVLMTIFGPIILFFLLMSFYPIPKSLKHESFRTISYQRCLYANGLMYVGKYQMESLIGNITSKVYFNSTGEMICRNSGLPNKQVETLCKYKICRPIFNYDRFIDSMAKQIYEKNKKK